jgi:predicted nucleic acid-binding protein
VFDQADEWTLLAATALAFDLTLVTRDGAALADTPVRLLDPWRA